MRNRTFSFTNHLELGKRLLHSHLRSEASDDSILQGGYLLTLNRSHIHMASAQKQKNNNIVNKRHCEYLTSTATAILRFCYSYNYYRYHHCYVH
jgi:hypothetical protein